MANCNECSKETRAILTTYREGNAPQRRVVCREYECEAFTEERLYPGAKMPKRETEKPKTEAKPKATAKKSTAKKQSRKKADS